VKVNDELKVKLVEDWASVTQKDMLIRLPRDPTVTSVLQVCIAILHVFPLFTCTWIDDRASRMCGWVGGLRVRVYVSMSAAVCDVIMSEQRVH
jgi:hypothetical protein